MEDIFKTTDPFLKILKAFLFLVLYCFFTSCGTTKNVAYFQDLTDTSKIYTQVIKGTYEVHIQKDDVLEIQQRSEKKDNIHDCFRAWGVYMPIGW